MNNQSTKINTRRDILRLGGTAAAALAAGGARLSAATTSKRFLVHVNLFGGNDSNNMLVPMGSEQYNRYANARGSLAIAMRNLWPIEAPSSAASYGLPGELSELRALYAQKRLAFVANTGFLPAPMSKGAPIPEGALSSLSPMLAYVNGGTALPHWVPQAFGVLDQVDLMERTIVLDGGIAMFSQAPGKAAALNQKAGTVNPAAVVAAIGRRRTRNVFPTSRLGRSLQKVAQLIAAGPEMGMDSGVILVGAAQFSTFLNQADFQPALYRDLSQSLAAFEAALEGMGLAENVTLYTQTEFNRSMVPNARGGTDAAWGGHEIVLGGAVRGGEVYGAFPDMVLGGMNDARSNGTWIPTTSHLKYGAAMAAWLGLSEGQLSMAFPGLSQFPAGSLQLFA